MKKRTATKHTTGHIFTRGKHWYCQWRVNGKAFLRVLKDDDLNPVTTKSAAKTARDKLMARFRVADEVDALQSLTGQLDGRKAQLARMEDEANPPLAIADAWKAFEQSPRKPDSGDRTLSGYENQFKRFAAWAATPTKKRPAIIAMRDVTPSHASAYAQDLNAAKVTPSTFNQHIGLLRLAWKVLADEAKTGGANPWGNTPKEGIKRRKLQSLVNRKRALTPEQFDALHAAASGDPDLQDLFTVLAWTGQRLVDGLKLRWEAVSFQERVISLYPQKTFRRTGKAVHIPIIFPPLLEVLNRRHAAMPHTAAEAYVFPQLVEDYDRDAGAAVTKRIGAIFEKAKIKTTEERPGLSRAVVLYGAHSFRHLFVTAAAAAGLPAAMIKAITGHSSDAMSEHYQQFDVKLASEFAKRLTGKEVKALPAGREPVPLWVRELLAKQTAENWQTIRNDVLRIDATPATPENGGKEPQDG